MELIYSPESSYNLLYVIVDMLSWRVLFILAVFVAVDRLCDSEFNGYFKKAYVLPLSLLFVTSILFYSFPQRFYDYRDSYYNYKAYNNYAKVSHIMGVIKKIDEVEERWEGNIFEISKPEQLWRVYYVYIGDEIIKLRDLDWKLNREFDMPLCYKGDFGDLLIPYVGKKVQLGYYETKTTSHHHDKAICLVDAYEI